MTESFEGYLAATFSPMTETGEIDVSVIPAYALHLRAQGVSGIFVNGTTGECHSLSVKERKSILETWMHTWKAEDGSRIVHVGHQALPDALELARHAHECGVDGISLMPPSYFKPAGLDDLIRYSALIAREAPDTPFYYYHIPRMTGVNFPMHQFLKAASKEIPTCAGIKYSEPDFMNIQECLNGMDKPFKIFYGCDESLLACLDLGVQAAIGSTYNFLGAVFQSMLSAKRAGDFTTAAREQYKVVQTVALLNGYGYLPAAKQLMHWLGCPCGPVRQPLKPLDPQQPELLEKLNALNVLGKQPVTSPHFS